MTTKKGLAVYKVYQLKIQGQHDYFSRLFTEAKWWTNFILAGENLKAFDTKQKIALVKRGENFEVEPLTALSSQMRQMLHQRLLDNVKGLATKKKKGAKVGRFKFKPFVNSIPLSNQTFRLKKSVKFQACKKAFRVCGHRQLPENPNIRCGELIRKPSGIYLSVTVKVPDKTTEKQGFIGVDMGIKDCLTFHDGTKVNFSSPVLEKRIRQAHKSISRKQKESKNRHKAKKKLRRLEECLYNQKKDATNKLINKLKPYTVCFQDELIKQWHSGLFGKQVQGSILGQVKAALKQDTANLCLDSSLPTTQLCPECGKLNKHGLEARVYTCQCGYSKHRDKHSANNMLILSGRDTASAEKVSDVFSILQSIVSTQLSVKQESYAYKA